MHNVIHVYLRIHVSRNVLLIFQYYNKMNCLDIFSKTGQAIKIILSTNFIPQETDFVEFTDEDYSDYQAECGPVDGKMFTYREGVVDESQGAFAFAEEDKDKMLEAALLLRSLGKEQNLTTDDEILKFAASALPNVFSQGLAG